MAASKTAEKTHVFLSNSPTATLRFGKRLGEKITTGGVVALIGELGCGKILFTRGSAPDWVFRKRRSTVPPLPLSMSIRGDFPFITSTCTVSII